jgi:hypothetical protein
VFFSLPLPFESGQGLVEQLQRFAALLCLGPGGTGLKVDLLTQGRELGHECLPLELRGHRGSVRSLIRAPGRFLQPAAEILQYPFNGLRRQRWSSVLSNVSSGTRRRVLRHASSSIVASIESFLPASNSR